MTAVVIFLGVALLSCAGLAAVFLAAALHYARQRDDHKEAAARLTRENTELEATITDLRGRLTRKRKPVLV